jgi:hypothetical protein
MSIDEELEHAKKRNKANTDIFNWKVEDYELQMKRRFRKKISLRMRLNQKLISIN